MSLDNRNAELEQRLKDNPIDEQIAVLARAGKRLKLIVMMLAVLTAGLGLVTVQTYRLADRAEKTDIALVRDCESRNESRASNREIWNYIIQVTNRPDQNSAQKKIRNDFIDKLDRTFAPKDCSKVIQ
jgi:hypothetical protein